MKKPVVKDEESLIKCEWCEEWCDDGGYEVDIGWMCSACIAAMRSRGEKLTLQDIDESEKGEI